MSTEQAAVHAVQGQLLKCPNIHALIDDNDRTPLTDGNIDLYTGPSHRKVDLVGRVPIQVKGTHPKNNRNFNKKFSIKRSELQGHLKNAGVLYFVVAIYGHKKPRVHYRILSPSVIHDLLNKMKNNQKTISFPLKELPKNPSQIERIISVAYNTRKEPLEQFIVSEDLLDRVEQISLQSSKPIDISKPLILDHEKHDFSLVFETSFGPPIHYSGYLELIPESFIGTKVDRVIKCGDVEFSQPLMKRVTGSESQVIYELNEGLQITLDHSSSPYTAEVVTKPAFTLYQQLENLRFMNNLVAHSTFSVDQHEFTIKSHSIDEKGDFRPDYELLSKMAELFSKLKVDMEQITMSSLEPKRIKQLLLLRRALIDGETFKTTTTEGRVYQPIGDVGLEVLCAKCPEKGDESRYVSMFDLDSGYQFAVSEEGTGEPRYIVTPYDLYTPEKLAKLLNLNLGEITAFYDRIESTSRVNDLSSTLVLNLISAADLNTSRKDELLNGAHRLNQWTIDKFGEDPARSVNKWQICARLTKLTEDTMNEIRDLKHRMVGQETEEGIVTAAACSILLEEHEETSFLINKLSEETLALLKGWPIWYLHLNPPSTCP